MRRCFAFPAESPFMPFMAFIFSILLLSSGSVLAATTATSNPQLKTLYNLQQLETVSYKAATSFYLYSVLNRDPQHFKNMQSSTTLGDALVQQIGKPAITTQWQTYKKKLTTAHFTEEGVADNPSILAVDGALSTLTQSLRQAGAEERKAQNFTSDKMADMLYDQYVTMQIMTAAYLRKSADYFGGAIVATQGPQVDLEKLANKFSSQLDQLKVHYAKNAEITATLKEVTTKWIFIRSSFINSNQNNVAFVIGRYNEQITDKLLSVYEKLL